MHIHNHLNPAKSGKHRRRIKTEDKAKVVAAVWGTELLPFLAALAILHKDNLKNRMHLSYSPNRPGGIHPILQIPWCKYSS